MSPVNPIFGLPASMVDRLSESDEKSRQKENRRNQKENFKKLVVTQSPEAVSQEQERDVLTPESSQLLDSEKVVELLGQQVKPMIPMPKAFSSIPSPSESVKESALLKKLNRAI
ncbi:MAG: hypothetical protein EB078_09290 [Proteobacteria bacterium]|nr:hypothetical protein [Pseudomonadota bacterium]NDC25232.1 hypothetical protein [Pseudomonadota bacterium]NDD05089.1 hypothetical protein [Pseudomonadota bacterium]NDG27572.1 hypothetical protein [Pseudomonadota bacterium]